MNLPVEILEKIFSYLHQRYKLECMLVCWEWKQVMEQGVLYDALYIYSNDGLDKVTSKLSSNSAMASKVNRLVLFIVDNHHTLINLSPILSILPNVQTISTSSDSYRKFEMDQETELPFYNRIQVIHERPNSVIYPAILSNVCPQLTSLRVDQIDNDVVPLLKNVPNLTSLTIDVRANNFGDLATVYNFAPYIQYMRLSFPYGDTDIESLDSIDLTPAPSVTECVFEKLRVNQPATLVNLLTFVGIKYPNLTKFTFNVSDDEARFFEVAVHDVIENGWRPLYQKLGPQLEKLDVGQFTFKGQLIPLDAADARINHLCIHAKYRKLLTQLAASDQIYYIRTLELTLENSLSTRWLKKFRLLVKLKFGSNRFYKKNCLVNLSEILKNAPPRLKDLTIHHCKVYFGSNYDGDPSNVTSLCFRAAQIPNGTDAFLSRFYPHLTYLTFDGCDMTNRIFNLADINLISFGFSSSFERRFWCKKFTVVTLDNEENRLYNLGDHNYRNSLDEHVGSLWEPYESRLVTDMDSEFGFKLICNSLKNIDFH